MKKIYSIFSAILFILSAVSCSTEELEMRNNTAYLKLDVNTVVSTVTRANAPTGYDAHKLYVEIKNNSGVIVKSTNDFENDNEFKGNVELEAGKYTVNVHSNGWDGNGSGFDVPYYVGSATVNLEAKTLQTVKITCTQANVKVTVNFDASIANYFQSATSTVSSAISGIASQVFKMGETSASAYFPVGNLTARLDVVNKKGVSFNSSEEIKDVKARDHYILNYKLAEPGYLGDGSYGSFKVVVDETTKTYTYTFYVPKKSATSIAAYKPSEANIWSTFVNLNAAVTGTTSNFNKANLKLQWRKNGTDSWTDVPNASLTINESNEISYTLKNLQKETSYDYRIYYIEDDNEVTSDVVTFKTDAEVGLENASFENWNQVGDVWYPNAASTSYWDTSNPGSAGAMGPEYNVTSKSGSIYHSGSAAAKLESMYVVIKFAAASLYTGTFKGLIGTKGAKLDWGVPFKSRPTSLTGYMRYTAKSINRGDSQPSGAPAKNAPDVCQIYCALLSEQLHVANVEDKDAQAAGYELSTGINWENDPRVIAYGELSQNTSDSDWKKFDITLKYHDLTKKPKYMLIVCSSSKYGDYFYGGEGSTLYLDDFSFNYGEPTVK